MRALAFLLTLTGCLVSPSEIVVRDGATPQDAPQDTGSALPDGTGDLGAGDTGTDTGEADSGQDVGALDSRTPDGGGVGADAAEDVLRESCDGGFCNPGQTCALTGTGIHVCVCGTGRWDCNGDGRGNDSDGCEADFRSDPRNCGGCRRACNPGWRCVASACVE